MIRPLFSSCSTLRSSFTVSGSRSAALCMINAPFASLSKMLPTLFLLRVLAVILATLPLKLESDACTAFIRPLARLTVPAPSSPVTIAFPLNASMLMLSIALIIWRLDFLWWIYGPKSCFSSGVIVLTRSSISLFPICLLAAPFSAFLFFLSFFLSAFLFF